MASSPLYPIRQGESSSSTTYTESNLIFSPATSLHVILFPSQSNLLLLSALTDIRNLLLSKSFLPTLRFTRIIHNPKAIVPTAQTIIITSCQSMAAAAEIPSPLVTTPVPVSYTHLTL